MSNKKSKMKLIKLFGKQCFIEKLHLRKDNVSYTGKKQKRKMNKRSKTLTYHHIRERQDGGEATVANGAIISEENHIWFNQQTKEKQQEMNLAFQEYKINVLLAKLEDKGLRIETSKELNVDMADCIEIPLEENTIQDKIYLAIMKAIDSVETDNLEDGLIKTEMLLNINKYLSHYEELRPALERYFESLKGDRNYER